MLHWLHLCIYEGEGVLSLLHLIQISCSPMALGKFPLRPSLDAPDLEVKNDKLSAKERQQ